VINFGSVRYLVSLSRSGDLRQSANHLFLRAMRRRSQPRVKGLPEFGGAAGRAAPHQRGRSRLANATTDSMRLSASAHPSIGVDAKAKREPETQTCATGTRGAARREPRSGLFDIVKKDDGRAGRTQPGLCNCVRTHSCLDAVRCRLSRDFVRVQRWPACTTIRLTFPTARPAPGNVAGCAPRARRSGMILKSSRSATVRFSERHAWASA
jgi:hypothetical protein